MENFQHKINLMKQQINTIRSDIESIATENNNNNNYIISTNYSTPSNPLFTTNSHHKSHSPNFNKPSIKTKYIHRKNSHSQHYNLLFKTNNNAPLSDYNSANRNETFQRKLPITSNSMYMNHKTNKIYKPNDNMNIRHKKGKSVVMSNTSRGYNEIGNSNDVVKELIDITNKYHEDKNEYADNKEVTPGFVVENYKRLLKENTMYREFIRNISKLYKNKMGNNCGAPTNNTNTNNNSNTVIELWKWINYMSHNNDNSNTHNNNNSNKYQQYCEQIMFEHNLQTFNDFTSFINHLLNKSTKNETFLDGIKKLLLVNNKIDTYPQ